MGFNNAAGQARKIGLEHKRRTEQKLGLLGLHAANKESTATCPSHDEMALFTEHKLDEEPHNRVQAHITDCEQCYEEWLLLAEHMGDRASKNVMASGIELLTTPKSLGAIGSGLALAASVIIFLSLPQNRLDESRVLIPEKQNGTAVTTKHDTIEDRNKNGAAGPLIAEEAEKNTGTARHSDKPKDFYTIQQTQPSTAPLAKVKPPENTSGIQMTEMPQKREMKSALPFSPVNRQALDNFKTNFALFCRQPENTNEHTKLFKELQTQGKKILTSKPDISRQQQQFLYKFVQQENITSDNKTAYCIKVFKIFHIQSQQPGNSG